MAAYGAPGQFGVQGGVAGALAQRQGGNTQAGYSQPGQQGHTPTGYARADGGVQNTPHDMGYRPVSQTQARQDPSHPVPQAPWLGYQQPTYGGGQAPMWQPRGYASGAPPMMQPPTGAAQLGAQQSIAQQALAGGGNAQQTQNFLRALQASGAGSNNTFLAGGAGQQAPAPQLLSGYAQGNGDNGMATYAGGFGAQGGGNSYYGMAPGVGLPWGAQPMSNMNVVAGAGTPQHAQAAYPAAQRMVAGGQAGLMPQQQRSYQPFAQQPIGMAQNQQMRAAPQQQPGQSQFSGLYSAMSDERVKTSVEPGGKPVRSFLDALGAHEYEYKNPKHGQGRFVSPMAQELEATDLGKSAVVDTPEGKAVDYGRIAAVQLAATADIHHRLKALEEKGGDRG